MHSESNHRSLDPATFDADVLNPAMFLGTCQVIDWDCPAIRERAALLAESESTVEAITKCCFHWVRDRIQHSGDCQLNPVTCCASQVLAHETGFCYAKSHLLCALLRANGIPSGLCYQRLRSDDSGDRYCLHGLCAVYLAQVGWYWIDPRGNRSGIDAQFTPPHRRLAFEAKFPGECDLPGIFASPLPEVVEALGRHDTWQDLADDLPDFEGVS